MKLDVIELTKELNSLRLSGVCLSISEFREKVRKNVSYSTFPSFLLQEGFATASEGQVYFSKYPIHITKVEKILKLARNKQYGYNKETERKKYEKELRVDEVIKYLKDRGYIIIKPVEML